MVGSISGACRPTAIRRREGWRNPCTGAAAAMAWRAVVAEGRAADAARRSSAPARSAAGSRGEFRHHRAALDFRASSSAGRRRASPAERAVRVRVINGQAGNDPVADRPDDRGVEDPQPPARQRRVEFADAVPLVPRGLCPGDRVDLALSCAAILSPPRAGARGIESRLAEGQSA